MNSLRWAGHLARMNQNRVSATLLRNDAAGHRGVGPPKARGCPNGSESFKDQIMVDSDSKYCLLWKTVHKPMDIGPEK